MISLFLLLQPRETCFIVSLSPPLLLNWPLTELPTLTNIAWHSHNRHFSNITQFVSEIQICNTVQQHGIRIQKTHTTELCSTAVFFQTIQEDAMNIHKYIPLYFIPVLQSVLCQMDTGSWKQKHWLSKNPKTLFYYCFFIIWIKVPSWAQPFWVYRTSGFEYPGSDFRLFLKQRACTITQRCYAALTSRWSWIF